MTDYSRPFGYRVWTLVYLLLLWPMAGVLLAVAGLASAYWAGQWLVIPYVLLLVAAAVGLALALLRGFPQDAPGGVVGFTFAYLVLAGVLGVFMGTVVGRPYLELTGFPPVENLRVREAVAHAAPGYRHFRDGRILAGRSGIFIESGVDSDGFYYEHRYIVAPVVPDGWAEGDPITLWVVTGSQETAVTQFAEWTGPVQGMVATRNVTHYQQAIQAALDQHNLHTKPDALLLRLYDQGYAELQEKLRGNMRLFLGVVSLVGWLPLGICTARREI